MANKRKHCQGTVQFRTVKASFEEYVSDLIERTLNGGSRECRVCGEECDCVSAIRTYTGIQMEWRCEKGHFFVQDVAYSQLQVMYRCAKPIKHIHNYRFPHSKRAVL